MLLPLWSFCAFLVVHWVSHFFFSNKSFKWTLSFSALSLIVLILSLQTEVSLIYVSSCHFFLIMLYLHLYVGIDRSVSVRIMNELLMTQDKSLTLAQLEKVYPQQEMFEHRVRLMVKNGWLKETSSGFELTQKSKWLARMTIFLRSLYGLKQTW